MGLRNTSVSKSSDLETEVFLNPASNSHSNVNVSSTIGLQDQLYPIANINTSALQNQEQPTTNATGVQNRQQPVTNTTELQNQQLPATNNNKSENQQRSATNSTGLQNQQRPNMNTKVHIVHKTPKHQIHCPFLRRRGYCLTKDRCDFLHAKASRRKVSFRPTLGNYLYSVPFLSRDRVAMPPNHHSKPSPWFPPFSRPSREPWVPPSPLVFPPTFPRPLMEFTVPPPNPPPFYGVPYTQPMQSHLFQMPK